MKNKNEKKGLLGHLIGSNKDKKSSCCGGFRIEEITDESADNKNIKDSSKENNNCCRK